MLMDAPTEEEEMWRRRVGGGERGMSRAPGRCICSAAASAVNSHAWTHIYSGMKTDLPTYQQLARQVLISGFFLNNVSVFLDNSLRDFSVVPV